MPKRPRHRGHGRRPPERHLYLVFDDWLWGYSIRKLDLSSDDDADEPGKGTIDGHTKHALPQPVFRLEAPRRSPMSFTAAFGTMIMATHHKSTEREIHPLVPDLVVPIFDVRERGVVFGPRPNEDRSTPSASPGDDRLFVLSSPGRSASSQLPDPVFYPEHVKSYAVHPDGQTIYVSAANYPSIATFTFDMEEGWKLHGEWMLPVGGRAHFDPELNAWVGLSRYPGLGRLCACDVVPANTSAGGNGRSAAWKLGKEMLFCEAPEKNHVGATLLHMGAGSRFCLVQCVYIESSSVGKRSST
ncbi:hypothetical protein BAE44_0001252 [Dichanthelium oligosanthes]|uniref:Uncharacterized protein n=1 Tax=Dichanthelium oligosanthes TaxID=888268 RepID=A0A1E5WK12_9POAL|nr:hypothetical protein BAE44_0001252 [Dichanthelium oligosanthes]